MILEDVEARFGPAVDLHALYRMADETVAVLRAIRRTRRTIGDEPAQSYDLSCATARAHARVHLVTVIRQNERRGGWVFGGLKTTVKASLNGTLKLAPPFRARLRPTKVEGVTMSVSGRVSLDQSSGWAHRAAEVLLWPARRETRSCRRRASAVARERL